MTYTREFVKKIYDTYEQLGTKTATARKLGIEEAKVRWWLSNPGRNDPYLDMVAVERALLGERKVYQALTRWEEAEVHERLIDVLDSGDRTDAERGDILNIFVQSWGVTHDALTRRLDRIRAASRAAA